MGPPLLYWLGTSWWCSTIFCFCLLSFPRCFYCSRLVLLHSAVCLCLVSSCISYCVYHFLWFGFSFLHTILAVNTSCYSLFLFIVLLYIIFHTYPFIQKGLCLCRLNNVVWIKRVLGSICLDLSKQFCWRTVFCGWFVFYCRFVFCCRSAFCCRLLSLAFLSLDLSCFSIFLVGL